MIEKQSSVREIAVPITVFAALRSALEKEAGTLAAVRALHHAGYEAGAEAAAGLGDDGESLRADAFWERLEAFLRRRGWGTLRHERAHPGLGILQSTDWTEASPQDLDTEGSCAFSTGFLAGVLTTLASGPVAVLEVSCRTRGDDACRFAYGSEATIQDLYGRMLDGSDLAHALAEL